MKSILKFGIAAVLALSLAKSAFAVTAGDAFLFSTSATDPNAGTQLNVTSAGTTAPLYIWVTSSAAADDITPASTAQTPGGSPTGAAALALNGAVTTSTGLTIGTLQYYTPTYTGSIARWSATSPNVVGGTSFTNFEANTAMQSPAGVTYPAGTVAGLSRSSVGDPMYFPGVTVPNSSTGGAWLLGQVTFNATTTGLSTLALSASSLDITKSGPSTTTVLTSAYAYGSASINVNLAPPGRIGDINGDNNINALDIDLMSTRLAAGGLPYDLAYDYRGATVGSPPDGIINQFDKDRLVGSLIDNNGVQTSVGTHYGDATLDGKVGSADYITLINNYNLTGKGWADGDFSGDGKVGSADYITLINNYNLTGGTGQVAAVPEPSTMVLGALSLIGLVGLRRRASK